MSLAIFIESVKNWTAKKIVKIDQFSLPETSLPHEIPFTLTEKAIVFKWLFFFLCNLDFFPFTGSFWKWRPSWSYLQIYTFQFKLGLNILQRFFLLYSRTCSIELFCQVFNSKHLGVNNTSNNVNTAVIIAILMLHIFHYYSAPVVIKYISQMLMFIASQSAYILKLWLLVLNGLSAHFYNLRSFTESLTHIYV